MAAILQHWWGRIEPGCEFVRTPSSGGWSTPAVRSSFKAAGDIMTTAARWPFTVEVKRREGWAPGRFLAGRPSPVWGWWLQAQAQAKEQGGEPMLWLRRNGRDKQWTVVVRHVFLAGMLRESKLPGTLAVATHKWLGKWPAARGARPIAFSHWDLCVEDPGIFAYVW